MQFISDSSIGNSHGPLYDAVMWGAEHWSEVSSFASDPAHAILACGALVSAGGAGVVGAKLGSRGLRAGWDRLHGHPGEITLGVRRDKLVDHLTDPPVKLRFEDACKGGVLLVGPTGQGKTTLSFDVVIQALLQEHTVILLEADGDLVSRLREYLEALGMMDRFFCFDPSDAEAMKWNPLAGDPERVVQQLVDTVASVSVGHEFYSDVREDVVRHMAALCVAYAHHMGGEATVKLLLRLLVDHRELEAKVLNVRWRGDGGAEVGAPFVSGDLKVWLEQEYLTWGRRERREYLVGLRNLLRKLLSSERVVEALTPKRGERTIDIGRALNSGGLIALRATSNTVGNVAAQSLLTWALQRVQQETLGRKLPMRPVLFAIDEAHAVLGRHNSAAADSFSHFFVQARKFNVAPILGYQSFLQLPGVLQGTLDDSARNKIVFGGLHGASARHAQDILGHTTRRKEEVREVAGETFLAPRRQQRVFRSVEEPYYSLEQLEHLPLGYCIYRGVRKGRQLPPVLVRFKEPPPPGRLRARAPGAPRKNGAGRRRQGRRAR